MPPSLRLLPVLLGLLFGFSAFAQTIPAGTHLSVRLNATVSSESSHVGDIVPCTLNTALTARGQVLARRGTPLRARVTYARQSGRFHKPGYVTVRLDSIDINGRRYRLHSSAVRNEGNSHTKSNVEKIGGGAGLGALVGALAGGGKGALIGGLVGGGAGTGVAAATGKQHAELPAEAVYTFRLTRAATPESQ